MSIFKQLASQTAIYGLTSIVGRLVNYILTPLLTAKWAFQPQAYGVITELYAYVAFVVIFLGLGLETSFFRHASRKEIGLKNAFSASLIPVTLISFLFFGVVVLFKEGIGAFLGYATNTEYLIYFAAILAFDAISAIPLAGYRFQNQAKKFALINMASIFTNLILVLIFIGIGKRYFEAGSTSSLVNFLYKPEIGVAYVFIANLAGSAIRFILVIPDITKNWKMPPYNQVKLQLLYGLPLVFAGLGGIVNETVDRVLLKRILTPLIGDGEAMFQLGIYGANYKIAMLLALFLQAFRYAAEPFFFAKSSEQNAKEIYAKVMDYLVTFLVFVFLIVTLYLDVFKYFIPNSIYWQGLAVVPILMFAKMLLGIYYTQSIWYKVAGKTMYGAYISIIGATITIVLNLVLVPKMGYLGCAWATLAAYFVMLIVSQLWGQKVYPVPYKFTQIIGLVGSSVLVFVISYILKPFFGSYSLIANSFLLLTFTLIFYKLVGKSLLKDIKY